MGPELVTRSIEDVSETKALSLSLQVKELISSSTLQVENEADISSQMVSHKVIVPFGILSPNQSCHPGLLFFLFLLSSRSSRCKKKGS